VYGNGADFSKEEILAGGPCLDFAADKTVACANDEITFTFSCPVPVDNLQWNFGEGAIPATAVGEGPHTVIYGTSGIKTVVLMPDSFPVLTKAGYVSVNPAPADKALITLAPIGPEGHATSIIVVAPQPETQYQLRYDADDSPVGGSLPDTDTLATGALYISTTFNVLASNEITGCVAEMSTKVAVTIDPSLKPGTTAQLLAKATRHDSGDDIDIYPNPGDGNFDLIISNDYEGPIHCQIRRVTGQVVVNEMLSKSGDVFEKNYDLTELHGVYLLSVRFTGGEDNGIVRYRRLLIRK